MYVYIKWHFGGGLRAERDMSGGGISQTTYVIKYVIVQPVRIAELRTKRCT